MGSAASDVYEVSLLMLFVHVSNLSCRWLVSQSLREMYCRLNFSSFVSDLIISSHSVTGMSATPRYSDFCVYFPSLLFSSVSVTECVYYPDSGQGSSNPIER